MEASTYLIKAALCKAGKLSPAQQHAAMGALHGAFNGVVPGMIGGGLAGAQSADPNDLRADQALSRTDGTLRGVLGGGFTGALGGAAGGALGAVAGHSIRPSRLMGGQPQGYIPKGENPLSTYTRHAIPGLEVPGMQLGSRVGGAALGYGSGRLSDRLKSFFTRKPKATKDREIDSELKSLPSPWRAAVEPAIGGAAAGSITNPIVRRILAPTKMRETFMSATKGMSPGKGALIGGAVGAGTGALRNILIRHLDKERLQKVQAEGKKEPSKSKPDKDKGAK